MKNNCINQKISSDWKIKKFTDLLDKKRIRVGKIKKNEYSNDGKYPIIDQGQDFIAGYVNKEELIYDGELPVIIFGDHTRIFKYVDFPFIAGADGTQIIRPNIHLINPKYFYYALLNTHLISRGYSRHYSLLKRKDIPVPPLVEQRGIAEVLSTVDEAIQRTDAIIEKTEELKQGLMQWLLTRGIRHTKFKQTELGEIPETWKIRLLKEILIEPIKNGISPNIPTEVTGLWNLSLSALSESGFKTDQIKPAPINIDFKKYRLHDGDVLVSRSNTRDLVGLAAMYQGVPDRCIYPDLMMRVRVDSSILDNYLLEQWLRHPLSRRYLMSQARGTSGSMVKINQSILENLLVPISSRQEQIKIKEILKSNDKYITQYELRRNELLKLKQGLMQLLLTGKVRVGLDESGLHRIRDS